ncbi:hypothetical protein IWZ03DRAFT_39055 [Phyllosticta citriasiana]|uniref:Complex III subunit 9 n=1 Tax=Phyllosticta citriasiana TaxID=595635 RepID=A0ABR1KIG9_9PEZI
MAGIAHSIYNTIIKRNYIFVSTVFVGAFGLQLCVSPPPQLLWSGNAGGLHAPQQGIRHRIGQPLEQHQQGTPMEGYQAPVPREGG